MLDLDLDSSYLAEETDKGDIKPLARRGRFHWNRDYDELARDASTIIKARCRSGIRIEWAALEQVFPAVPKNSVRQRMVTLREVPGAEAYLKRLEDRWYELWFQHRGTADLPDEDPQSPTNFDLTKHVEFLRKHIDKNAMYVLVQVFVLFSHICYIDASDSHPSFQVFVYQRQSRK